MILFIRYGLITPMQYNLMFTPKAEVHIYKDKVDEDILHDFIKYQPLVKNLIKEFNLTI